MFITIFFEKCNTRILLITRYFINSYDKIRIYHDDKLPLAGTSSI